LYDAAGRRTGMPASGRAVDFAYNEAGRELTRRIGETLTLEHTFDALGHIVLRQKTRLSRKPDTWRHEWDAEDRLTSVVTTVAPMRFGEDLPSRIAAVTGSPEFLAVSMDGHHLCAASAEEDDYWVVQHEFS
jgi:hypothetical protein